LARNQQIGCRFGLAGQGDFVSRTGNLTLRTDEAGLAVHSTFDAVNRLTEQC
jgi:hypothetical protein